MKAETIMLIISGIINLVSVPTSVISSISAWKLSRSQMHNTDVDTQAKMLANVKEAMAQMEDRIHKLNEMEIKMNNATKMYEEARKYQIRYERSKNLHFNLLSDDETAWWSINNEGQVEMANHTYRDIFGINVEDVSESNWVKFVHDDDRYRVERFWERFRENSVVRDELKFRVVNQKTKQTIPVICKLATLHDADGTVWEIVARSRKENAVA